MRAPILMLTAVILMSTACKKEEQTTTPQTPKNPLTAEKAIVDRFSSTAGHLMIRDNANGLPLAGQAINFDAAPFITKGLGPNGEKVEYYNFDVQPTVLAPIYVLFKEGENTPVAGQLNIINVIPGETGYNDFWQMVKVTVPSNYVANTLTSLDEINEKGYAKTTTANIINCPVVPYGSTASKRIGSGSSSLMQGWYKEKAVFYFTFEEKALTGSTVPTSPIYVSFKINPNQPNGGPSSGFVTESNSEQTHNVIATLPSQTSYSPLWSVNVYDNVSFSQVSNLTSVSALTLLGTGVALVNCPVVKIQ